MHVAAVRPHPHLCEYSQYQTRLASNTLFLERGTQSRHSANNDQETRSCLENHVEQDRRFTPELRRQLLSLDTQAKLACALRGGPTPIGLFCCDWKHTGRGWKRACSGNSARLNRSFSTVDHRLRAIREKLGARSTARIVAMLSDLLDTPVDMLSSE
jgi:hypothetical protein